MNVGSSLTLNLLLSFAQFEREIAGERIRDKIAASKAKGMWMGNVPLGYDVRERKLVMSEAAPIQHNARHVTGRKRALETSRAFARLRPRFLRTLVMESE